MTLPPEGTASPTPPPAPTAVTVQTKLTIKHRRGSKKFTGKVKTGSPCKRRVVRIVRGSKQLKSKKSRRSGGYRSFKKRPSGKVRARVTKKTVVQDGVTYTCTAAKSRKVRS